MEFDYEITYSKKRKRTISIEIKDCGTVKVSAPIRTSEIEIKKVLMQRKSWILKKLYSSKQKRVNKIDILKQNKILYLGQEILIVINKSALLTKQGFCQLENNQLIVNIPQNTDDSNKLTIRTIREWYKESAKKQLENRTYAFVKKYNLSVGDVFVKQQKRIWGSCDCRNNIRYNWRIIMAKEEVIDYLVVHELAHIIEKNHSQDFWKVVKNMLPNYKTLRKEIKNLNHLLLIDI
jgi:predicted metal-dependent hydrolase